MSGIIEPRGVGILAGPLLSLSVSQETVSFREDFQRALDWRGVRMEFHVYAAFGHVTKVVSNGRVNAKPYATSRNWLLLCPTVLYGPYGCRHFHTVQAETWRNFRARPKSSHSTT